MADDLRYGSGGHLAYKPSGGHLVYSCAPAVECCKIGNCCFEVGCQVVVSLDVTTGVSDWGTKPCCNPSRSISATLTMTGCGGGIATFSNLAGTWVATYEAGGWSMSPIPAAPACDGFCSDCDPRTIESTTTSQDNCCGLMRTIITSCAGARQVSTVQTITVINNHCCRDGDTSLCKGGSPTCATGVCV